MQNATKALTACRATKDAEGLKDNKAPQITTNQKHDRVSPHTHTRAHTHTIQRFQVALDIVQQHLRASRQAGGWCNVPPMEGINDAKNMTKVGLWGVTHVVTSLE